MMQDLISYDVGSFENLNELENIDNKKMLELIEDIIKWIEEIILMRGKKEIKENLNDLMVFIKLKLNLCKYNLLEV